MLQRWDLAGLKLSSDANYGNDEKLIGLILLRVEAKQCSDQRWWSLVPPSSLLLSPLSKTNHVPQNRCESWVQPSRHCTETETIGTQMEAEHSSTSARSRLSLSIELLTQTLANRQTWVANQPLAHLQNVTVTNTTTDPMQQQKMLQSVF